jgi:hypothetical protein
MEKWQLHEKHEKEVRAILKETGCMDQKNQLRAWKKEADIKLEAAGHTSLSFDKCKCNKTK